MALVVTYAKRKRMNDGTIRQPGTMAFDSSYPSGGEAVTGWDATKILAHTIYSSSTYDFTYDHVNKKVVAWDTGTGAEVANATNLSALTAVKFELTLRD